MSDQPEETTAPAGKANSLVAAAPDDAWFRVKDRDTGHVYSIGKSAFDSKIQELLVDAEGNPRPGRNLDGTVIPQVYRNAVDLKNLPNSTTTADTAAPPSNPEGPAEDSAVQTGQKADSDKEKSR